MTRCAVALIALLLVGAACSTDDSDSGGSGEPGLQARIDEFVAAPNSLLANEIAGQMGDSGDVRWVPWLVDLLRLGRSTALDDRAAAALERLTGRDAAYQRVPDLVGFGSWMYDRAVDPGGGYAEFKTALYQRVEPAYTALFADVDDRVTLARLQFGGVIRGGIPELNDPARLTVAEASFMEPDEIVYGAEVSATEIAYPLRIMGFNELANDVIDGRPVAMVLCTLCRTAVLFDRRVDGRVLDFETSGLLLNSNKVMVDRQTDSLWNEITGEAISGQLAGSVLEKLPVVVTRWADWVAEHPDTLTLDLPDPIWGGDPERPPLRYDYLGSDPQAAYYASDDLWFPAFDTPDVFDLKAEVVTIERDGAFLAVGLTELVSEGPVVLDVGGRAVLVVPTDGGARVYDASGTAFSPGVAVDVVEAGARSATVRPETAGGPAAGEVTLDRMVSGQSFWFAWYGQHPETAWWPDR